MVLVCNDKIGTLDVIDTFEKNDVQTSTKIQILQNSAQIDWNVLKSQDRVRDIKNLIKEMGRT